jgi:hypothetical protein
MLRIINADWSVELIGNDNPGFAGWIIHEFVGDNPTE